MKKVYTIRNLGAQQIHMWDDTTVEQELDSCPARNICGYFKENLPADAPILEAGCGLGAWVIYLKELGYAISGIDHDPKVVKRVNNFDNSLDVKQGDICNIEFPDNHLGGYISLGVVEHFEEGPSKPLAEAMRVLKPGGVLVLTVPFNNVFRKILVNHLRSLYLFIQRRKGKTAHFAEYRYSESEVREMLSKAGFRVLKTDIDDFTAPDRSLGLWSEFPFLQASDKPYSLNTAGRFIATILNTASRKTIASGILAVAVKP